jgi:hypothetical protein
MRRKAEDYHDGAKDGLEPLESLDLKQIDDFDEFLKALGKTAFGARTSWRPWSRTPTSWWWALFPGP